MASKEERQQNVKKNIKDVERIEDLDMDKIDMIRGDTPVDIKEQCLKLCKEFLSGIWAKQTVDTIDVQRVSGGVTNQLYYCGLIDKSDNNETTVPQEVAVRLYGSKHFDPCDQDTNERLSDVIIGLLVAEKNLGPKIYGFHESGEIHKWYKHEQFKQEQQKDPKLVKQLFQNLARIHCLDVPIKKNTNWKARLMEKSLDEAFKKFPLEKEIDQFNCETLKNNDLRAEMKWCEGVLAKANSPIVFCHNDFRSSNLMVTEPHNELVVCDFEYGGYGHRGGDFGVLMTEWGRNPADFTSMFTAELPPPDSTIKELLEIYVEECIKIKGKAYADDPINSVEHILKEVKLHLMYGLLFIGIVLLNNNDEKLPMPRNLVVTFADMCFKGYLQIKEKLIKQNLI